MENVLKNKSFEMALQIIAVYKELVAKEKEYVMSKQLLRSGTSVGAMIREAQNAESKMDFVHKLAIAQKEQMRRFTGWNYFIIPSILMRIYF
jgi:four helix bundle protein